MARLQHAVSSAAKVPVVAVIEYNYEHDGQLVVPAGTRAYGEISQATPQGWVSIRFRSLEFPHGEQQTINGSAISMEREMLRGHVNGKNTGLKAITRTLTGIGTIAAYAVGGRGAGGSIDSSILLRERLASNVALTGEQQLATLAYQQNIVVTIPAKTQFNLVLHEAGALRQADTALPSAVSGRGTMSDQEVREVTQLRNEIREMNRLMRQSMSAAGTELSSK
ncbi:MAG: TrbI/VirB10 family protein [Bryobacterales bacterium]|nr:TrbI/VirB10 family protein [Bryobacterales bacterium]